MKRIDFKRILIEPTMRRVQVIFETSQVIEQSNRLFKPDLKVMFNLFGC